MAPIASVRKAVTSLSLTHIRVRDRWCTHQLASSVLRLLLAVLSTMAAALQQVFADPVVDFRLGVGDGTLSDDNINQAGGDVPLQLDPQHWLAKASGGATVITYRQVEVAFCSSLFFDAAAAAGLLVARCALSLAKEPG